MTSPGVVSGSTTAPGRPIVASYPPAADALPVTAPPPDRAPAQGRVPLLLLVVLALFLALAVALALTRAPHTDEGHFASAGAAMATEGRLVMPMWTEWIPTLDQHAYATMPAYFVLLGGWFKAFGVSFASMRLFSVAWGVVLAVAWYAIGRHAGRTRLAGLLVVTLVALNYDVINAATARYDIMAAALNSAAIASYLWLRPRRLDAAVLVSQALVGFACLTHPYGVLGGVGVLIFALSLDLRRFRWRHLGLAALPYAVEFGAWAMYVTQDFGMFRSQFGENASGRLAAYRDPLGAFASELRVRYVERFGGWREGMPLAARAKVLLLPAYAAGIIGCLAVPALRRVPMVRALALYAITLFLLLTFLESNRWYIYLIHAIPTYAACVGLLAAFLWERGRGWRAPVTIGIAGWVLFTVASVGYRVRTDVFGRAFAPTVAYLQAHVRPGQLVMAGGEFGVGLGFADHVLDDSGLGFRNGRVPDFVVVDRDYAAVHARHARRNPARHAHVTALLSVYTPVFESETVSGYSYRVYARAAPVDGWVSPGAPSRHR